MNATIDLSHRIFKDIDSNYALVNIDGKKMVMMKANGYINISNINKKSDFVSANNGKAICEILEKKYGVKECIIKSLSGSPPFEGMYAHPCLAIHLLRVEEAKRSVGIAMAILNECKDDKVLKEDSDEVMVIIKYNHKSKKSQFPYAAFVCHRDEKEDTLEEYKTRFENMKLLRSFPYDSCKIKDIKDICITSNRCVSSFSEEEEENRYDFEIAKGYSEKNLIEVTKAILAGIYLENN